MVCPHCSQGMAPDTWIPQWPHPLKGLRLCDTIPQTCMLWWMVLVVLLLFAGQGRAQTDQGLTQELTIAEEVPLGTVLGVVGQGLPGVPSPYIYLGNPAHILDLDRDGTIRVNGRMDREVTAQYNFVAVSTQNSKSVRVVIHVTDINDHSPEFPESIKSLALLESTPTDAKYALGSASDPDLGVNSTQRYEIVSGNQDTKFRLGAKRAPNGLLYLDLEINGELDFEEQSFYSLVIRAYDGGTPPRYGTMRVNIAVIDANDNQPIFNQSRYFARIQENSTIGTSVLQVFATDIDSGENGKIRYHIDNQRSDPEERFGVNAVSGVIYVNNQLDYESNNAYELIVVAQDNGTQKLQTTAVVSITVSDVNDNAPDISVTFLTPNGQVTEGTQPGETIARISVTDPDLDSTQVNVTLAGGEGHFGLRTSENVVYLEIVSQLLDREVHSSYTLTIIATDSGSPPLQASKDIVIHIMDINDNAPAFAQTTYYADIQEVVPAGTSVIQLTASDPDSANNSLITYEILDTPDTHSDWFQIDRHTGLVTTKMRVDCEMLEEPQLTVVAKDSGLPQLSGSATVMVRIWDVNDNQPVFDQSFYNVTVREDVHPGTCILTVG